MRQQLTLPLLPLLLLLLSLLLLLLHATANAVVHVFLNGQLLPQLYMRVCDDGVCVFPDGSLQPPLEATKHMHPVPGVNALRFEVCHGCTS
jgi:hypothetical protein